MLCMEVEEGNCGLLKIKKKYFGTTVINCNDLEKDEWTQKCLQLYETHNCLTAVIAFFHMLNSTNGFKQNLR